MSPTSPSALPADPRKLPGDPERPSEIRLAELLVPDSDSGEAARSAAAIAGLTLHDHACLIFESADQQRVAVVPFIKAGLQRGERCLYLFDESTGTDTPSVLRADGVDLDAARERGQLVLLAAGESYLRDRSFDPDRMIALLARATADARADGFAGLRITGEMTWALNLVPGVERLMEYEARLNDFFPAHDCLALCQYSRARFPAEIIRDVIRTHPIVIHGGRVCRNPHYLPPRELLGAGAVAAEVEWQLQQMAEQQQAEAALRESHGWLTAILDHNPVAMVIVDRDRRVRQVNRAAANLAGQPVERMFGAPQGNALRCLHALADPRGCGFGPACASCTVRATVLHTLQTGEARVQIRARLPLRSRGGCDPADLLVSTVPLEAGGRRLVLVSIEDVSCVVQTEASLRTFLEAIPESAFIMTPDGRVVEANSEVAARLGTSRDELLRGNIYDRVPEDVADIRRRKVEEVLQSRHPARFTDQRGGRCIDNIIAPVPDPDGTVNRLAVLGVDITDHEAVKAALRASEERLKRAQRVARVGDWDWDVATGQASWSDEVYRIFGLEPGSEQPSFELARSLVHPDDVGIWEGAVQQALDSQDWFALDYRVVTRSGTLLWIHNEARIERDEHGRRLKMFGTAQDITDRKRAEEALRESEARFRGLVENANDIIFTLDLDGTFTYLSPNVSEKLGFAPSGLLGTHYADMVHPESLPECDELFQQVTTTGQTARNVTYRVRHRDGGWRWHTSGGAALKDAGGRVVAFLGVSHDVTERRQAELELQRTLEATTDGIWTWDFARDRLAFSSRYYTMLGYEPGEFPATFESWRDLIHPEDRERALAVAEEYLRTTPDNYENEFRLRTRTGAYRWIRTKARVVERAPDGRALRLIGNHEDITDRKQAEERLRDSEQRYRRLVELAQEGIWTIDAEGRTTFVNPCMAEMLGCTPDEMVGRPFFDFMDEGQVAAARDQFRRRQEGLAERHEFEFRRTDGVSVYTSLSTVPLHNAEGSFSGALAVVSDITERKLAEEALRASEARYRAVVSAAHEGIILQDRSGQTLAFNETAQKVFGISEDDASRETSLSRDWGTFREDGSEFPAAEHPSMHTLRTGEPCTDVLMQVRGSGREFWINLNTNPLFRDGEPEPYAVVISFSDITEHRRAEEALRESERNKVLILNSTAELFVTYDRDLRILWANRAAGESLGLPAESLVGRHCYELWGGCDRPCPDCPVLPAMETGRSHEMERFTPDGRAWFLRGHPLFDDQGNVVGALEFGQDITERKRAEQALRASEEKFAKAFQAAPLLVTIGEVEDGRCLEVNDAFVRATGFSREDARGRTSTELGLVTPEDRRRLKETLDREGRVRDLELELTRADGSRLVCLYSAEIIEVEGTRRLLSIAADITQRKRAEEELREALLWQQSAIKAGNVGFWDWDLATDRVAYSREWKSQIGYGEDEIGDGLEEWESRVHPEDLEFTLETIRQWIAEGRRQWEVQFRFRHRDGSYRWILAQASIICDAAGRPARAIGTHVDVTESRQAEEALRQSEGRVRAKLDAVLSPEGDFGRLELADVIDTRAIQAVMDEFYEVTRIGVGIVDNRGDVLVATGWQDICTQFHRRHPETARNCLESDTVLSAGVSPGEYKLYLCRNGMYDIATPLFVGDRHLGNLFLGQFFFEDELPDREAFRAQARRYGFDERSYLEALDRVPRWSRQTVDHVMRFYARFANLIAHLSFGNLKLARALEQQRVAEQVRRELEEQLRQSQKLEAVGQLAGGVAHDFNNLLTAINGYSDQVDMAVANDPAGRRAVESLREVTRQAAGVTRSLLTFSSKVPSHKERVELRELVRKTAHLLQRMVPASVHMATEPPGEPPVWLYADGIQLQQVIMNLALNARDAMPAGGRLEIRVAELSGTAADAARRGWKGAAPPAERFAELAVSDTGTGIPPETRERIFEPFFTTKARGQGTGLGLAIVHGIVQEHGGRIEVESTPGRGSTFRIILPVVDEPQAAATAAPAEPPARARGELVLLAEDNWNVRSMLATFLQKSGFQVLEAADGAALMQCFTEQGGDAGLLVVDVDLPQRNGLDCLRAIREGGSTVPVIITTGGTDLSIEDQLDAHTALLRKPFGMAELQRLAVSLVSGGASEETEA